MLEIIAALSASRTFCRSRALLQQMRVRPGYSASRECVLRNILVILMAAFSVAACASVVTKPLVNGAEGIAYALPTGKIRLIVTENDGVLAVLLQGPVMEQDPNFRLVSRLPRLGLSNNNVTVTVGAKTNLLEKVEVTSTGQATEIITNIAKSFAFLQGADESQGQTIFSKTYDIDRLPTAAAEANLALEAYFRNICTTTAFGDSETAKQAEAALKLRCTKLRRTGADAAARSRLISIVLTERADAAALAAAQMKGPPTDRAEFIDVQALCERGVCYRPLIAREVTLTVGSAFQRRDTLLVPDPLTVLYVNIVSGVFAEQKYTLTFTDGVLTSYKQDQKSELVGLTALPVTIATTILSAPAEALGLRQKDLQAQISYLDTVTKLTAAQNQAAAACASNPNRCPDTAFKIIGGPVNATPSNAVNDSGGVPGGGG